MRWFSSNGSRNWFPISVVYLFYCELRSLYVCFFLTNFKEQLWYSGGQDIYLRNRISAFIGYMWVVRCLHLLLYVYTMYAYFLYQDMYLIDRHSKRYVLLANTEDGSLFSISISSCNHKETKKYFYYRAHVNATKCPDNTRVLSSYIRACVLKLA